MADVLPISPCRPTIGHIRSWPRAACRLALLLAAFFGRPALQGGLRGEDFRVPSILTASQTFDNRVETVEFAPEPGRDPRGPGGPFDASLAANELPTIRLASDSNLSTPAAGPLAGPDPPAIDLDQNSVLDPAGSPQQNAFGLPGQCFDPEIRFRDDAWQFLPRLAHDAWGLVNWNDAAILGVALGGSLAIRSEFDGSVRDYTAEHPDRWGEGSKVIGDMGVAQYQIPVILGAYAYTVWSQDAANHEMMSSLISAYTLTGLSTVTIKVIANTKRPSDQWNGGNYGFPSYHAASMFAMAAVLDEYEGPWIGIPSYILAGLVGWSRIDTRDHDLSDVVFGSVLGYVIGKSVAGKALYGDSRVHILPYVHPTEGSAGVMLDASF